MFLKFFRQTLPQVIIVLIILALVLWLKGLYTEQLYPHYFDSIKMPFYAFIIKWLPENIVYSKAIAFIIMLFTAFYLLQINSKHIVIKQRTYLPAFFYILISSCFISLQRINPAIFSALIMVFVFDHIFSLYHKENALDNIFKASFYISLASLFYAPSIFYFFTLLMSIMSIRTFNIREWFVALFGVITPWFFFFLYHNIINTDISTLLHNLGLSLLTPVNHDSDGIIVYLLFIYCAVLILVTSFYLIKTIPTQKINVRKYHGVFFWFNVVSVFVLVFISSVSFEITLIAIIPFTFQFSHYFTTTKRKFWPEVLFLLLIILVAIMQFE